MENYHEIFGCCVTIDFHGDVISIDDLEVEPDGVSCAPGKVYVRCGWCNCWMQHRRKTFKCPECETVVKDADIYDAIQDENNRQLKEWEDDYREDWE